MSGDDRKASAKQNSAINLEVRRQPSTNNRIIMEKAQNRKKKDHKKSVIF